MTAVLATPASPALAPELVARLGTAIGLPLDAFRPEHVARQIARAEQIEGLDAEALARRGGDPDVRARLRASVAVSVTGRGRDGHQLALLESTLLDQVVALQGTVRAWSAGCSDGSELLDIADMLTRRGALKRSHLLGSDLMEENLHRAVTQAAAGDSVLRNRLRWEQRDLTADGPPAGAWHLVVCRNVAIYLTPEAKAALHRHLAAALAPRGILLLGRSERIADPAQLGLEDAGPHLYRRAR